MSKVLFYKKETDTKAKIMSIHNQPDKLDAEMKERGYEIKDEDMPPKPDTDRGERALPYLNPETGEVWYEVEKRDLTDMEQVNKKLEKLEERISKLE